MPLHKDYAVAKRWTRIKTLDAFLASFADQPLYGESATFVIHSSGQITGTIGSQRLFGEWFWKDGLFWRRASLDGEDLGVDSEVIEKSGRQMRYTSDGGRGHSTVVSL